CCNKNGFCGLSYEDCNISTGCQPSYGICLKNELNLNSSSSFSSTISISNLNSYSNSNSNYGSCIVKGSNLRSYAHISCCSKDGICGLSAEHCGEGCQSEFGVC
ncbi:hypothetical protein BCR32DRAFT_183501, partial [Anaeromyces robustus]